MHKTSTDHLSKRSSPKNNLARLGFELPWGEKDLSRPRTQCLLLLANLPSAVINGCRPYASFEMAVTHIISFRFAFMVGDEWSSMTCRRLLSYPRSTRIIVSPNHPGSRLQHQPAVLQSIDVGMSAKRELPIMRGKDEKDSRDPSHPLTSQFRVPAAGAVAGAPLALVVHASMLTAKERATSYSTFIGWAKAVCTCIPAVGVISAQWTTPSESSASLPFAKGKLTGDQFTIGDPEPSRPLHVSLLADDDHELFEFNCGCTATVALFNRFVGRCCFFYRLGDGATH